MRDVHEPSLADALEQAAAQLDRAGVAHGRREATALWAALAGVAPGEAWLRRDEPRFRRGLDRDSGRRSSDARAVSHSPTWWGGSAFRELELNVDHRALIPRPETEGLIDLVLAWVNEGKREGGRGTGGAAADIGTGCGCIALSLAVEGAFERVVAVERSPDAATLARENVASFGRRCRWRCGRATCSPRLGRSDSGRSSRIPRTSPLQEYDALDASVRGFEPREALVSGSDGLDATRALLAGAAARLEPGGLLALEIDERRGETVDALARAHGWARTTIRDDLFGRPRYALVFSREEA